MKNKYNLENTVKNLLDIPEVSQLAEEIFPEVLLNPLFSFALPYRICDVLSFFAKKSDSKKVALFKQKLKTFYDEEEQRLLMENSAENNGVEQGENENEEMTEKDESAVQTEGESEVIVEN